MTSDLFLLSQSCQGPGEDELVGSSTRSEGGASRGIGQQDRHRVIVISDRDVKRYGVTEIEPDITAADVQDWGQVG